MDISTMYDYAPYALRALPSNRVCCNRLTVRWDLHISRSDDHRKQSLLEMFLLRWTFSARTWSDHHRCTQFKQSRMFPWCKFVQKARIVFSEWHFRSPFPFFKVFFLLKGIPSEFMEHFDPRQPLIVGGLVKGEEAMGFVQARFHAHRWLKRVLKSNDPITVSLGWRRYQTIGVFSK